MKKSHRLIKKAKNLEPWSKSPNWVYLFFIKYNEIKKYKIIKEVILKKVAIYKNMKNILVYMGPMCGYCDAAKRLLNKKNIPYKEINIALDKSKMDEMIKKSNGKRTIPQIFIEDFHVGGYKELRDLENKKELDNLLK